MITDAEFEAWERRAIAAADALSEHERQRHLNRIGDCSAFHENTGTWGIIGYNGVDERGFKTERDAENYMIVHICGAFDDA